MSRLSKEPFDCVASTSQEGHEEAVSSVSFTRTLRVTLLSSEWRPTTGGVSTINRELAIQLAKLTDVEVTVYLPECSEDDKRVAGNCNVKLMQAEQMPGYDPVDWLVTIPDDHAVDCVIGHGVSLGKQVQLIQRQRHCKWVQVVYTDPEELGMFKSSADSISEGQKQHQSEVWLCKLCDQVVAVGPKLADAFSGYLRPFKKDQNVLNLTPGIFSEFADVKQASEERRTFSVLVLGHGSREDLRLKGYDIAAQAIGEFKDNSKPHKLLVVGVPSGQEEKVAGMFLKRGIDRRQLVVRSFKGRELLAAQFCEVDLAIMPSRTEGFGLTALEALSAGLPVIVSGNSGLGEALRNVAFGSFFVLDSEDPKEWAKAISSVRNKRRDLRLKEAKLLREEYKKTYSWEEQCRLLVQRMMDLATGFPGDNSSAPVMEYSQPAFSTASETNLRSGTEGHSSGSVSSSVQSTQLAFHAGDSHCHRRHVVGGFSQRRPSPEEKDKRSFSCVKRQRCRRSKQVVADDSKRGHKQLQSKRTTSNEVLVGILDGLWQNQLPNFEMEQVFNILTSQLEPRCSVCCFFFKPEGSIKRDDLLAHLREHLHRPLTSLTADSVGVSGVQSVPRVPEIRMPDDFSPESMRSWLDHKPTADTASPLLRCESCKLLVHASCYGASDVSVDGSWNCQRCSQENGEDIEKRFCSLCTLGGGALKRCTDNRWAHLGCAVAMPEVSFVDVNLREGINISQINPATRKLTCFYCRQSSVASGKDNSACVQCKAEKCTVSFHVTCFVLAGFGLEPSDWPQLSVTYCERHQGTRFEGKQRNFSMLQPGESVIAKHANGGYYSGVVLETSKEAYYEVSFNDGSHCYKLAPSAIESHDATRGDIPVGSVVQVKWGETQDLFTARVTGRQIQIEFEDDSWLNVRRDDVYKTSEELPLEVRQQLGKQRDLTVISRGESVIAKHKNGRYYCGVVKDTSSEEYYEVSFDVDGTHCLQLPPSEIVGYDSMRGSIQVGSVVQVKWGERQDLYTARVIGRWFNVTYKIEFEDDSWLNVRRDDVYKTSEELPLKVQHRLSSATKRANLSYWDIPDDGTKRPRK